MKHASTAMKALALSFALSLAPINGVWAQGNAVKGTVGEMTDQSSELPFV